MEESEIEKVASIIGRDLGIVLKKSNVWGLRKEGDGFVFLYDPLDLINFSNEGVLGVALHEACHIKFRSHDVSPNNFPKAINQYAKQLGFLLNAMENWRIESLAQEPYPLINKFFKNANEDGFSHRIPLDEINALTFCEFIDRLRFDYKLSATDFKGKSKVEFLKDIERIMPIIEDYSKATETKDRVALIKKAWPIYKKYIKEEKKNKPKDKKIKVPRVTPIPYGLLRGGVKNNIRDLVDELRDLKLSENTKLFPNKTSGKLNLKKLYRAGFNNPKLFQKKLIEPVEYPEFSIWLDTSGSMVWNNKIYFGLSGMIMISEALDSLGITFTLGHFAKSPNLIKRHNERFKKIHIESIYKNFGGGTHEYKALRLAYNNFSGRIAKKVTILITDGATESLSNLKSTMNYLDGKTKVIAVGINLTYDNLSLFPHRVLTTPQGLAKSLSSILKKELQ